MIIPYDMIIFIINPVVYCKNSRAGSFIRFLIENNNFSFFWFF